MRGTALGLTTMGRGLWLLSDTLLLFTEVARLRFAVLLLLAFIFLAELTSTPTGRSKGLPVFYFDITTVRA